ncbi:Uncharacterised protein [Mycobacteroides abscessus subsp. bolletii]|uniref:hypothetical protein n=1 Tax=Mycobacteroides abscessus TaxID=36809 RepID=UPI0009A8F9A8|nr:hypothetical protein [Mycobacteroides abscessus]SKR94499.1 Uncharacterised protein [Mycobacteroides abscessus subsp. bolletii]SKS03052.1 Uncharacterised protein [Mycobacteroides abscessus subsp. bolletii]
MKTTIERLRIEREGVVKYLDSLDKEIRREEATGAPVEPSWPFAVITFVKVREDDQQPLNYAAIRNGDRWVLTQDSRSNYPQRGRTWDDLMRWIGPDEWPTVTVMVEGRKGHVQFNVTDGPLGDAALRELDVKLRGQQL